MYSGCGSFLPFLLRTGATPTPLDWAKTAKNNCWHSLSHLCAFICTRLSPTCTVRPLFMAAFAASTCSTHTLSRTPRDKAQAWSEYRLRASLTLTISGRQGSVTYPPGYKVLDNHFPPIGKPCAIVEKKGDCYTPSVAESSQSSVNINTMSSEQVVQIYTTKVREEATNPTRQVNVAHLRFAKTTVQPRIDTLTLPFAMTAAHTPLNKSNKYLHLLLDTYCRRQPAWHLQNSWKYQEHLPKSTDRNIDIVTWTSSFSRMAILSITKLR